MKNKAIFKFNNSLMALLCSKCRTVIKIGSELTKEEFFAAMGKTEMPAQYCNKCKV